MGAELNNIINYDASKYPFQYLFCNIISEFLGKEVRELSDLHKHINLDSLPLLSDTIYRYFRCEEFINYYHEFCITIIDAHFSGNAQYQAVPALRIQFPGAKTVNFHHDVMYGHGQDIVNIWVPLVRVCGSNSLQVLSEFNSQTIEQSFGEAEWSIAELNRACLSIAEPLSMNYGQYFMFHAWVFHGSVENTSDKTRVSFDTRLLPNNGDYGLKDRSFFVMGSKNSSNRGSENAAIYMHYYDEGLTSGISARYQSVLCQRYAENNQIKIEAEETEIRTVGHQPTLYDLCFGACKGIFKSLVMVSILLLPKNKSKRKSFLYDVLQNKMNLHFVLEDHIFDKSETVLSAEIIYQNYARKHE